MGQNALERALWPDDPNQGSGRVSRYMSGDRGKQTLDPLLFLRPSPPHTESDE
jgi:hypothetical protein